MVQIDVLLLPTGAVRTQVNPDPTSAHTNDWVNWVFRSLDPTVESVQIEFDHQGESYFFPRGGGPPFTSLKTDLTSGGATIWGRAPGLAHAGSQSSKYSIRAFDSSNHEIAAYYLDPTVVTEQP